MSKQITHSGAVDCPRRELAAEHHPARHGTTAGSDGVYGGADHEHDHCQPRTCGPVSFPAQPALIARIRPAGIGQPYFASPGEEGGISIFLRDRDTVLHT
jgi:hypothetical protein